MQLLTVVPLMLIHTNIVCINQGIKEQGHTVLIAEYNTLACIYCSLCMIIIIYHWMDLFQHTFKIVTSLCIVDMARSSLSELIIEYDSYVLAK